MFSKEILLGHIKSIQRKCKVNKSLLMFPWDLVYFFKVVSRNSKKLLLVLGHSCIHGQHILIGTPKGPKLLFQIRIFFIYSFLGSGKVNKYRILSAQAHWTKRKEVVITGFSIQWASDTVASMEPQRAR